MPPKILRIGDRYRIAIPGNPTTGYSWTVSVSNPQVTSLISTYLPVTLGMIGTGGLFVFEGIAKSRGTTTLTFSYQRPWENQPVETRVYTIRVI